MVINFEEKNKKNICLVYVNCNGSKCYSFNCCLCNTFI